MKKAKIKSALAAVLILAVSLFILSGCSEKTVEKTLTLYNLSDYPVGPVNIVTPEGLSDIEKRIYLIDLYDTQLEPSEIIDYNFSVPEKDLTETWYLSVHGSVDGGTVGRESEMGTIWEDEVAGFYIFWDDEEGNFYFEPFYY